jgi:tetratricopeptide (TPR) repeat protein
LLGAVIVLGGFVLPLPPADAGTVRDARAAWEAGRPDQAYDLMLDFLVSTPRDQDEILEAAYLAGVMRDQDLLERLQGVGETFPTGEADARLDLALGLTYLGLAEVRLARRDQGPTLAFLFADAEARARDVVRVSELRDDGLALLARTRAAQGDAVGALQVIDDAFQERGRGPSARLAGVWGGLLYERALQEGIAADGRPTEDGGSWLASAYALLVQAVGDDRLLSNERRTAWLTAAYAAHRLGRIEQAAAAYREAHWLESTSDLALRGLSSLFTGRPAEHAAALEGLLRGHPSDVLAMEWLATAHFQNGDVAEAVLVVQRLTSLDPSSPRGWLLGGRLFRAMEQWREARKHFVAALERDPEAREAITGLQQVAMAVAATDAERAVEIFEELLTLRPNDPYVRNNLGFLLREVVSPWTTMGEAGIQTLRPEAPPRIHELLARCVEVYREAVDLIPEEEDDRLDELTAWNLAGIVNDYGLIIHYFADVQDPAGAEAAYHRALRMTDYAFKDTYAPNIRRLYGTVLTDRELTWYRIARLAKDAILREERDESGVLILVPDDAKQRAAAEDEARLRTAIQTELAEDAEGDGG